jgi:ketosteroid isomerase-like protein
MSRENVEVGEAMGEAWNAVDMAALREVYDPDVIVRVPDGPSRQGLASAVLSEPR